ncbi:patatin-like phospholipase family protein [Vibrio maerlii]|uniref:patatin-like phospholipase family protein n=1 Tax=Vibrio maerlii TaxID=2231648 RepID=UPI000E3ED8C3|nr:patatin-like phospholipase family protein [Vibrio maerlii]
MLRIPSLLFLILSFFLAPSLYAKSQDEAPTQNDRPTIAVVLAGGGAKGAAHIGVLRALEELNIPVDIITGTSMGAYVGGLYSSGKSIDEIEGYLTSVDWYSGYQDGVERVEKSIRDKKYEDRYQITSGLGLSEEGVEVPKSAIPGHNMLKILRQTTGNPAWIQSFDDFPIRYRSVATDIVSLEQVVLDRGYLVDAMMASMSVPAALPPYEIEGRLLIDGGVTNNMPVDLAKELGADVVIAVDISSDYKTKDEINTLFDVGSQLSNYLVRRSTQDQINNLSDNDILLNPAVGQIETTDFSAMPQAYQEGYVTAMQQKETLSSLSISESDYRRYKQTIAMKLPNVTYPDGKVIDEITVTNISHYNDQKLEKLLTSDEGEALSTEEIEEKISRLYSSDKFERVTYSFQEDKNGQSILNLKLEEKSWGPNYLNFRFFLEEDFDTQSQYGLGVSADFTGLNDSGAELRTNFELGTDKLIDADLYFPISERSEVYGRSILGYSDRKRSIASNGLEEVEPEKDMDYFPLSYKDISWAAGLGFQPSRYQSIEAGGFLSAGKLELTGIPSIGNTEYKRKGLFAEYNYDSLDDIALPTKGVLFDVRYEMSYDDVDMKSMGENENFDERVNTISSTLTGAYSIEKHTLIAHSEIGLTETNGYELPINPHELGGFNHLSGLPRNSLVGANMLYGRLTYRYRWFDNDFGMFKTPLYIGASAEYGGVWSTADTDASDAPLIGAGSIFSGIDTPIGPVFLSYGRAENGLDSLYLIIGNEFN